jgi:WD40 repeat protein
MQTLWTGAAIRRVCFLPSSEANSTNLIATIGLDGMLRMYDLNTLQVINQWQLGAGAIWDLTLLDEDTSSGGDSALRHSNGLVCSCDDGTVRIVFIPKVKDSYPINSLLPPQIILRTRMLFSVISSPSSSRLDFSPFPMFSRCKTRLCCHLPLY